MLSSRITMDHKSTYVHCVAFIESIYRCVLHRLHAYRMISLSSLSSSSSSSASSASSASSSSSSSSSSSLLVSTPPIAPPPPPLPFRSLPQPSVTEGKAKRYHQRDWADEWLDDIESQSLVEPVPVHPPIPPPLALPPPIGDQYVGSTEGL